MMKCRRILIGSIALAGAAFAGCAQEVGDIDRTSPNRIEKSALEGEWFVMQTVIDTNATSISSFPGLQGNLNRVFFDIEEDVLLVRRTHEDVPGIDTNGINLPNGASWDGGQPVAAFPITSHFNIQRQYNSSTGEQSNVISENSSDLNWYDNEYMRVDWSRQMINDGWDSIIEIQNMSSVTVGPQDEGPETTWYTETNEEGEVVYLDVVNTYYVMPDIIECILTFGIPAWGADCGPERVSVRSSYVKITEESDFISRAYDDFDMAEFGYFLQSRCTFDRRYECVDDSMSHAAAIWNLWDVSRNADGSIIPYAQRDVRPIAYYLNSEWPLDLIAVAYESAEEWSWAFRRTVAALQGKSIEQVPRMFYACFNSGTPEEAADVRAFADTMRNQTRAALLREAVDASEEGYANGACADQGRPKNIGDIRYSSMNWVNNGPWIPWGGYGPSGQDPLTGETIQGAANINGANYDWAAQRTLEIVKVINGEMTVEELGYGDYIEGYFDNLREETNNDRFFGYLVQTGDSDEEGAEQKTMLGRQVLTHRANQIMERAARFDHLTAVGQDVLERPRVRALMERPLADFAMRNARQAAPMRQLVGTELEADLLVPELDEGLGDLLREAGMSEEEVLNYISPARVGNAETLMEYGDRLRSRLLDRSIHLATDFDPYMLGFAREISTYRDQLIDGGMTPGADLDTELWMEIRATILRGVVEHEIGHTVGLRHNFEGSTDALNYHPEYWALRERTFNEDCDEEGFGTFNPEGMSTGEVAPRTCAGGENATQYAERSAQLLEEIRLGIVDEDTRFSGGIHEFGYSSIMDYDPKVNTHSSGLGLYDYAAIAYGYGNLVEVFDDVPYRIDVDARFDDVSDDLSSITVTRSAERVTDMDDVDNYNYRRFGGNAPDRSSEDDIAEDRRIIRDNPWTYWHYSILPMMFDGVTDAVDTADIASAYYPPLKSFDGVDRMAAMYNRSLIPADQADGEVVVPYRFCEDYREGSSSSCRVFDLGADEYEMMTSLMDTYESYYVTSFFRRQRRGFGLWLYPVISSMLSRYYTPAIDYYQFWLINFSNRGIDWLSTEYGGLQQYTAALEGVNFVGRALTTPTPGTYYLTSDRDYFRNASEFPGYVPDTTDEDFFPDFNINPSLELGIENGARYAFSRPTRNSYEDREYHWFLQDEILSHFWAKYAAFFAITDGSIELVGVDQDSNSGGYYIPAYLVFEEDITALFGGLIAEDLDNTGWCAYQEGGQWRAEAQDIIRESSYRGCESEGGVLLNALPTEFGWRDFNSQIFATIFAGANFDNSLDNDWFDNSGVYVYGTGDQPEIFTAEGEEADFEWIAYTDDLGTTYAAKISVNFDPTDTSAANTRVGYDVVQKMIDFRLERDIACPFQFEGVEADLRLNCNMTVEEADAFIEAYVDENGRYVGRDFYEIRNDLDNAREVARNLARTNAFFTLIDGDETW